MTLLNHIGVFVLLLLAILIAVALDRKLKREWFYSFPATVIVWLIFEAFYWTFKIFF